MLRLLSYAAYASAGIWLLMTVTGKLPFEAAGGGILGALLLGALVGAVDEMQRETRRIREQWAVGHMPPASAGTMCPSCGSENEEVAVYCLGCGEELGGATA